MGHEVLLKNVRCPIAVTSDLLGGRIIHLPPSTIIPVGVGG